MAVRSPTRFVIVVIGFWMVLGVCWVSDGRAQTTKLAVRLHLSDVLAVEKSLASRDSYDAAAKLVLSEIGRNGKVTAFEENRSFVYAVAASGPGLRTCLVRRMVVLRPSVIVLDDEVINGEPPIPVEWRLDARNRPEQMSHTSVFLEDGWSISVDTLLPANPKSRVESGGPGSALIEGPMEGAASTRFLHVVKIDPVGKKSVVREDLVRQGGELQLTISMNGSLYHLTLPRPDQDAGEIQILASDGKALLKARPFPAGILPHGPEGSRILEEWDEDYQHTSPPPWDIGHPALDLTEFVSAGKIRRCRAVDLGCGSGTDAIYLASQGFDVTGIDVAPTALGMAQRKAQQAGVSVKWILADVLAPPALEPFDLVYDRGCYHVVRDQNLTAYIDTLKRISHPGTLFFLLAARADDAQRSADQPGVTEEELRYDFSSLFDIEWLRKTRLQNTRGENPPGWFALLRRKAQP